MKEVDILGQVFGRLVVFRRVDDYIDFKGHHKPRYLCLCTCGKATVVRKDRLMSGGTTSCGCKKTGDENSKANCAFHPFAVDCAERKCDKCGWNPFNEELRDRRLAKLKRKDGTDE